MPQNRTKRLTLLSWGCCVVVAQQQPALEDAFDAALGSALGAWMRDRYKRDLCERAREAAPHRFSTRAHASPCARARRHGARRVALDRARRDRRARVARRRARARRPRARRRRADPRRRLRAVRPGRGRARDLGARAAAGLPRPHARRRGPRALRARVGGDAHARPHAVGPPRAAPARGRVRRRVDAARARALARADVDARAALGAESRG